jgi:MFS family permease
MIIMPFFFARLGVKKMLLLGMLGWVLRYILLASGNSSSLVVFIYIGILLHGISYDFFYVTGQIYVDKKAPENLRASLQGLITFMTYGVGWLIGANLCGWILQKYQVMDASLKVTGHYWKTIMLIPSVIAGVVFIFFLVFFKDEKDKSKYWRSE